MWLPLLSQERILLSRDQTAGLSGGTRESGEKSRLFGPVILVWKVQLRAKNNFCSDGSATVLSWLLRWFSVSKPLH